MKFQTLSASHVHSTYSAEMLVFNGLNQLSKYNLYFLDIHLRCYSISLEFPID